MTADPSASVLLAELVAAAEKATPGPWHVAETGLGNKAGAPTIYHAGDDLNYIATCADFMTFEAPPNNAANAAYIVAAQPANILSIASAFEEQRKRIEELEKALEPFRDFIVAFDALAVAGQRRLQPEECADLTDERIAELVSPDDQIIAVNNYMGFGKQDGAKDHPNRKIRIGDLRRARKLMEKRNV